MDFEAQYVSTARLEGTVRDLDGQPVRSGQISLTSRSRRRCADEHSFFFLDSVMMMRPTITDGEFSIAGSGPGRTR